jgi:hypothetical protein
VWVDQRQRRVVGAVGHLVVVDDDGVDPGPPRGEDRRDVAGAAVDGDDDPGALSGEPGGVRLAEAVAGVALGDADDDAGADGAEEGGEQRRRGHPSTS